MESKLLLAYTPAFDERSCHLLLGLLLPRKKHKTQHPASGMNSTVLFSVPSRAFCESRCQSTHLLLFLRVLNRQRLVRVAQEMFAVLRARLARVPAVAQPGEIDSGLKRRTTRCWLECFQVSFYRMRFCVRVASSFFLLVRTGAPERGC